MQISFKLLVNWTHIIRHIIATVSNSMLSKKYNKFIYSTCIPNNYYVTPQIYGIIYIIRKCLFHGVDSIILYNIINLWFHFSFTDTAIFMIMQLKHLYFVRLIREFNDEGSVCFIIFYFPIIVVKISPTRVMFYNKISSNSKLSILIIIVDDDTFSQWIIIVIVIICYAYGRS